MTCSGDTNGDGDCGRRICPDCNPGAVAAAVAAERAANQPADAEDPAAVEPTTPASAPPLVEVSLTGLDRSVEIKAPNDLAAVAEVALRLWEHIVEASVKPSGAAGFVLGEPVGSPPLEMDTRFIAPRYTDEEESRVA